MTAPTHLTDADREALMDAVAGSMRDLSKRIGPYEYAVPLARGVDLVVATTTAVEAIVQRAVTAALKGAALELKQMAAERMDEHGPHDARSGAMWDVSWWLVEEYPSPTRAHT